MPSPAVLGLDFGGTKIACAVADAAGNRLGEVRFEPDPADAAERTFDRGIAAAHTLLDEVAAGRDLAAVGACTFGIPRDDGIDLAPNIAGWGTLAFGNRLRAAFPAAAVRTATDVKAAARAEAATGALAGCDPGLYVNLGTGLAVALVVGSIVVTGRNGAAGEIGYHLRSVDAPADAPRLEEAVSGKALAAHSARLLGDPSGRGVANLLAGTRPGPAHVRRAFLAELAFHLVNLTITLDPQRIVVGGGLVRSWEHLRPTLTTALADAVPYPPELAVGAYPFDAALIGALDMAVVAAATNRQSVPREALTEGASA